jgi:hypothetical protein
MGTTGGGAGATNAGATPGATTTGTPGGGAIAATGGWSGQMRRLSPVGSIRGNCQLAQPAHSKAPAITAHDKSRRAPNSTRHVDCGHITAEAGVFSTDQHSLTIKV